MRIINIFNRRPRVPVPSDAVPETRLAELHRQIAEIKGRINILFFFVMTAAMLRFVFGVAGVAPW